MIALKTPSKDETRQSRPVRVAEQIKHWIVEHGLKAGDRTYANGPSPNGSPGGPDTAAIHPRVTPSRRG